MSEKTSGITVCGPLGDDYYPEATTVRTSATLILQVYRGDEVLAAYAPEKWYRAARDSELERHQVPAPIAPYGGY